MRRSQDFDFLGISVHLVIPAAVELFELTGEGGCFHPISVIVCCSGTIYFAVRNRSVISVSAAKDTTYFIICSIVSTGPFQRGMDSFSDRKM